MRAPDEAINNRLFQGKMSSDCKKSCDMRGKGKRTHIIHACIRLQFVLKCVDSISVKIGGFNDNPTSWVMRNQRPFVIIKNPNGQH